MASNEKHENTETHPLFPSGDWEDFYTYSWSQQRHMMDFTLHFQNNTVSGGGSDDVGGFHWLGTYDSVGLRCAMTKYYVRHTVFYDGYVDENGIWGTWTIEGFGKGGFHLWPKPGAEETAEAETVKEKKTAPEVLTRM